MAENLKKSASKVQEELKKYDFELKVKELSASTRTAQEAADAIGCTVAQIAKSLVFKGKETKLPILIITSGINRVSEKNVAVIIGEKLLRADADFVFEKTGFKIGGVPPVGHKTPPITLIDEDLLKFDEIWAAAGTPNAVFMLSPDILKKITHGKVICVK